MKHLKNMATHAKADSALVAAAPELYAALCEAVDWACRRCIEENGECVWPNGLCYTEEWQDVITKARGKQTLGGKEAK